ncbi:MAG: hypothetical protein ABSA85_08805 [Terracidiphilus sp.]|jgi:hypothetical protein
MFHLFTNAQIIIAVTVLVMVAIFVAEYLRRRKATTAALRNRFGTEYDRAVLEHGSLDAAEEKLADREARVHSLTTRELGAGELARFIAEWQTVQSRFLDHPEAAVTEADDLIAALLEARGYPKSNFEQRAADVSVTYPRVMENYRAAHAIAVLPYRAEEITEKLRTAMIQYRATFNELIQPDLPQQTRSAA